MSHYWMTSDTSRFHLKCFGQDSNLHERAPQARASANWATEATTSQWSRRDLNPHRLGANQASCQLEDGPAFFDPQRCGKDSNLHPRPSEGRALIRLSYHNIAVSLVTGHWSFATRRLHVGALRMTIDQ
jgi:hypothetical protein